MTDYLNLPMTFGKGEEIVRLGGVQVPVTFSDIANFTPSSEDYLICVLTNLQFEAALIVDNTYTFEHCFSSPRRRRFYLLNKEVVEKYCPYPTLMKQNLVIPNTVSASSK